MLHVFRGSRSKPVGEGKERLMQVYNKESPHRNKTITSSMVCFIQILFFSTQKSFVCNYDVALFHNHFDFYVTYLQFLFQTGKLQSRLGGYVKFLSIIT
jgi:hypothetical protein